MDFRFSCGKQTILNQALWCMQVCREPKEHLQGYLKVPQVCMRYSPLPYNTCIFPVSTPVWFSLEIPGGCLYLHWWAKEKFQKNYLNFYLLFSFH